MKTWFAIAALILALAAPSEAQQSNAVQPSLLMNRLRVGATDRSLGLYVPHSYQAGHAAPLIIALHGRFSSAQALHAMSHLGDVAERNGAIIAYPEVAAASWNDGGYGPLARTETPSDDVGFITAAINAIAQDYPLDRQRIFVVGYDSGGSMAYAFACRSAFHVAGVAVVSGPFFDYAERTCADARPTPMLVIHGDRDQTFPSAGLTLAAPQTARVLSSSDTLAFWRRVNGCGGAAGGTSFYSNSCAGAALAFVSVAGGEHDWFHAGPRYQLNRDGVDAAGVIGDFFFNRPAFALPTGRGGLDVSRAYTVYVPPSYNPARPMPLMVLMHGQGGTPQGMAQISHMNAVAARHGFIVVYPQGLNHEWNAFFDLVHQPAIAPQDDILFLKRLTQDVGIDLNVDRRRMYIGGFSNGGFMTLRMACSASNYFAAFASVAAELYPQLTTQCQGDGAPLMLVNGTADPMVRYNGVTRSGARLDNNNNIGNGGGASAGTFTDGMGAAPTSIASPFADDHPTAVTLSAYETAAFFIHRNHCDQAGTTTSFPLTGRSPGTNVTRFAPHNCANHNDVAFYVVHGGGHEWPGGPQREDATYGKTNQDIDTGEEMWRFFAAHSLDHDPR